jgi:two-component system, sensor histidine kinase
MTASAVSAPIEDRTRIRAAESRLEFALAGGAALLCAATLAYVHHLFEPITPPDRLGAWTSVTAGVIAVMIAVPTIVFLRRPSDQEITRVWTHVGKAVAVAFDLVVAASVWMLLPYASEPLRLLMVIFYAASLAGQVITTAESLATIAFGVFAVFGSTVLFFLNEPGPYSGPLALFLTAFGLLLLATAVTLKLAIRSAFEARLKAERASADLAQALRQVTTERDAKGRFIAAASHDIRQPLQAARLFFDQTLGARNGAERDAAVTGVRAAFGETEALLGQISDHLRLDSGAVPVRLQVVAAGELLTRVAEESGPAAKAAGMHIRLVPTRLQVVTDPGLTSRVLRNFIQNAIRHAGGERILLGARRRGRNVRLLVMDDGAGVPQEDRERLFDEYAQGRRNRSEPRSGLGLGLASARRIGEALDSHVDFDPTWTGGAAFFIDLPRSDRGTLIP